jgi:hypothetical protein
LLSLVLFSNFATKIKEMSKELYNLVANHLLESIPDNVKKVSYVRNLLGIGREAAYRRLRGEIPFTAGELLTIAVNLNESIDDVLNIRHKETNEIAEKPITLSLSLSLERDGCLHLGKLLRENTNVPRDFHI